MTNHIVVQYLLFHATPPHGPNTAFLLYYEETHMSDTSPTPAAPRLLQDALHRMAQPLLLFSGVLFGLLALSYIALLPRFTRLHRADGTALSPRAIAQYEQRLAADLLTREEERIKLILPVQDDAFDALKERKRDMSFLTLRDQLKQAAGRLGEAGDAIVLLHVSMDGNRVKLEGDVRNVGTRSMTVLAAYVEEIERLPFVADLTKPSFTREQLPDGGFRSPFSFDFRLTSL